jgi:hypothetical protein
LDQFVGPENSDAPWPATEFEIVDSALDGERLGIFSTGLPLEPSQKLETSDVPELFDGRLENETVVPGTPEEVIQRLRGSASRDSNPW